MTNLTAPATFPLGNRRVNRLGYGAMQLAGPGVFGPPKDRKAALAVLRQAVASGVNHIDTSDYYGPHVTNQIIREALHPYPEDLVIVTKLGALRGDDASWKPAMTPEELTRGVHDNLRNLGLDVLEVVNLRIMGEIHGPSEGSIEAPLTVLAELQRQGLIRHLGLSNATSAQLKQGRSIAEIVCVQNNYNLVHRERRCAARRADASGHRLCALLPARRLLAAAIDRLVRGRQRPRRDADADSAGLAAAPRAEHPADTRHLLARASQGEPCGGQTSAVGRGARPAERNRQRPVIRVNSTARMEMSHAGRHAQ